MEIEQPDSHTDVELLAERQFDCAYAEADINGAAICWRYWAEQLPMLSAGQAARLMKGLDPTVFDDLSARPTKADTTELCRQARMLEQLAIAQGKTTDTQHGWLAWAMQHRFNIHSAFRDEVNAKPLTAPAIEPTPQTATDPATPDSTPAPDPDMLATPQESAKERQARRHQMCIDAGLVFSENEFASLPRGIGRVARQEGISPQAFNKDVRVHISRNR